MIYITEEQVEKNLPMDKLIGAMKEIFVDAGTGKAGFLPRSRLKFDGNVLNTMPSYISKYGLTGLKAYMGGKNGYRGVVLLFNMNNYEPIACIESNILGQRRTGALPAMLTRELHSGAESFLLIGAGFQAEAQMSAMCIALDLTEIGVFSRTYDRAVNFADRMKKVTGMNIKPLDSLETLRNYEIITTATTSSEPIFQRKDLGDLYHVNLIGSNIKSRREVSRDVLAESDIIIVEDYEEAMMESAEISEVKDLPSIINLKDFMAGKRSAKRIEKSVFKTMGLGIEDIAAAHIVMKSMGIL